MHGSITQALEEETHMVYSGVLSFRFPTFGRSILPTLSNRSLDFRSSQCDTSRFS